MMRIIAGERRGKRLETLPGEATRPTLERVKQALFSAIQFELADRRVLDLFAGSGQLGLEALSRGAARCWFNDVSEAALAVTRRNIAACGFENNAKVSCVSFLQCVKMMKNEDDGPDLVFLDPPYRRGMLEEALRALAPLLPAGALVAAESGAEERFDFQGLTLRKEYRCGTVKVTLLEKKGDLPCVLPSAPDPSIR